MKLVEKKCPNCGGELKFNTDDKETKCDYCGKSYEIERSKDVVDDLFNADNYRISEEQKKKAAQAAIFGIAAVQIVPFIIFGAFLIIMFTAVAIFGFNHNSDQKEVSDIVEKLNEKNKGFVVDFKDLTEKDLADIHESTLNSLNDQIKLHSAFLYEHSNYEYAGMYLLLDDYGNDLYDVYKIKFLIEEEEVEYYGAIKYNDVKKIDGKLVVDLDGFEVNPFVIEKGKGYLGYPSCKDLFNKNIRGKLDKSKVLVSGDVYND